jgi:two-component sensor histidine kinase
VSTEARTLSLRRIVSSFDLDRLWRLARTVSEGGWSRSSYASAQRVVAEYDDEMALEVLGTTPVAQLTQKPGFVVALIERSEEVLSDIPEVGEVEGSIERSSEIVDSNDLEVRVHEICKRCEVISMAYERAQPRIAEMRRDIDLRVERRLEHIESLADRLPGLEEKRLPASVLKDLYRRVAQMRASHWSLVEHLATKRRLHRIRLEQMRTGVRDSELDIHQE